MGDFKSPQFSLDEAGAKPSQEPRDRLALSSPIWNLARILFTELVYLAPGKPGDIDNWDELSEWERGLYFNAIDRLLEERELVEAGLKLSDNDLVGGSSNTGE